jgi:quercetin dioxygenase-like cupin family protein
MDALTKILKGELTEANYREKVTQAEEILFQFGQMEIPVTQYFLPGIYVREITIPKDTILTGQIHKHPCLNIVTKGSVLVATPEGNKTISEGAMFESPAGVKRIGIGLEDCTWATVHLYNGPEVDEGLMKSLISCETYAKYDEYLEVLKLEEQYQIDKELILCQQ